MKNFITVAWEGDIQRTRKGKGWKETIKTWNIQATQGR